MSEPPQSPSLKPRRCTFAVFVVVIGIFLGQAALYGPSLIGWKILLPLDILAQPKYYLPLNPALGSVPAHNIQLADLVVGEETGRRFLASELRAGRFPLWNPYNYGGAPDIRPKFSPFLLLSAVAASPKVLPWVALLKALISGIGAYVFCRRVLKVAFWPAAVVSWCYPLTGFFVLWQGFSAIGTLVWLPWLLFAVDKTVRRENRWAAPALSVATWLVLVSGQLDLAGQALLASGLYAVWCLADTYCKEWFGPRLWRAVLALGLGWGLGFLLAAPYILPVLDYSRTGMRMARRTTGAEERPPVGLAALPQVVLPKMYGTTEMGTLPVFPKKEGALSESTSATYAGLLATLVLAPLAWCSRRHRSVNCFWVFLGIVALSWSLNIPGLVHLLRLPGLNLMSHNRFVFAASFAILALAAVGLDVLCQGQVQRKWWFWVPAGLLGGLCAWCIFRAVCLPEPIRSLIESDIREGGTASWVHDLQGVRQVQRWFVWAYAIGAMLCALGLAAWLLLWVRQASRPWLVSLLGVLMVADLIGFGFGRAAQCDPALYYPPIPALEQICNTIPGRVAGYNCLPANLASICGLRDIRGYDGVDPAQWVELLASMADPRSPSFPYAKAQWLTPKVQFRPGGDIRLPPVFDLLGTRYLVFRGSLRQNALPAFQGPDYWVMVNSNALPRAFVPQRVEVVAEDKARLEKLAAPGFNPREVAYIEVPLDLPKLCRGSAEVVEDSPTRITVSVRMETHGLVVLADRWDKGWQARLNGKPVPIVCANHAVRGVVAPAGNGTIEFRYAPASFAWGLGLAGVAAVMLGGWLGLIIWTGGRASPRAQASTESAGN